MADKKPTPQEIKDIKAVKEKQVKENQIIKK